ncbi:hypothetical protein H5410_014659 [Solanum commersonii]|uniref:Uncharacterized protein n=1 Tax=Solanum commersonii TaxID=4109 RepID=A0A9J5ZRV1_SOLCO|nr:hypothetical protein H5410_014659 [Solanum commersonii]
MSPNHRLINTPNLNFCLSSSKTQVQQLKKDASKSVAQDSVMNAHNKTLFTHARINCALKDSSCDSPLSNILKFTILASNASSSSTNSNGLTQRMIPYSQTRVQQLIAPESPSTLTLTKMNTCMTPPVGFSLFSNQHLFQLTQDHKGLFKDCNGDECKGMVI